jgi:hypothetical protein
VPTHPFTDARLELASASECQSGEADISVTWKLAPSQLGFFTAGAFLREGGCSRGTPVTEPITEQETTADYTRQQAVA